MDALAARRRARIEGRLDADKISSRIGTMQVHHTSTYTALHIQRHPQPNIYWKYI